MYSVAGKEAFKKEWWVIISGLLEINLEVDWGCHSLISLVTPLNGKTSSVTRVYKILGSSAICKWRWKLSKIGCSIYGLRLKYWMHKTLIYFTSEPNFGYKVVQPCTLVSTASVTCAVYMYTCRRSSFEF